jgi:hypothetical protein
MPIRHRKKTLLPTQNQTIVFRKMAQNSIEVSRCNLHLPTTYSDMVPGYRPPEPGSSSSLSRSRQYRSSIPDRMGRIQRHIWLTNQAHYTPSRIIYQGFFHGSFFTSFCSEMRLLPCLDLTIQYCEICSRQHTNDQFHLIIPGFICSMATSSRSRNTISDIHHITHPSQSYCMVFSFV